MGIEIAWELRSGRVKSTGDSDRTTVRTDWGTLILTHRSSILSGIALVKPFRGPCAGMDPVGELRAIIGDRMPIAVGTAFQIRVWQVLARIPFGKVATYGEIAAAIGSPGAARAVGSAVGSNPLALLIPCHRVLAAGGHVGGYRWGIAVKRALLAFENPSHRTSLWHHGEEADPTSPDRHPMDPPCFHGRG